jgi:hypothetical protein
MTKGLILSHLAMCSLLSPLIMSFGHVFTFVTTYVIWAYVPFCHHLLCDLVMCSFCHYLLCHLVMCSFLSPLMSFDHMFPFCHHLLCHLIMCSLLSLLIMSSGHRFPFVITYYVIWPCVPFLSPLMSFGHMFPFCHHLLCHLIMCSFLSLLIMPSDHLFPFVITYYVIWSYVPFCHYLLCHLVIWSLFSPLIMSSGHVFPFVTTYYVIWSHVPFLSPFIMSSGHVFPFVTTYYVLRSYVFFCHYLLCYLVTCSLFVTTYYVIWPCVPFCHHLLCTQVICFLLSPLVRWPYITLHLASHFYYVRLLYAMLLLNLMRSCGHMPRYLMQHLSLLLCHLAICYVTFHHHSSFTIQLKL